MQNSKKRLIWERFDWSKAEKPDSPDSSGNYSKKNQNTHRFTKKDELFIAMERFDSKSMQILGNGQFGIVYRVTLATEITSK